MSTMPGRHLASFSWFATKANTSERGRLMTRLFSAEGMGATLSGDEGAREVLRVERPEVVEALSYPDQLHRQAELVRDRDGDAAFGAAVELRQCDACDADRFPEEARLLQTVLARGRVDDEQCLVRRACELAFDDASDLGQLLHQVRLRVQPSRGVDDHDVASVLGRALDRVERDGGGVGAAL